MMISLCIEKSVVKLKSDVWILKVQLNMKLWWNSHLQQIEVDHVIKMLMLNWLEIFTWKITFAKTRQIYSAVIRLKMMFETLIWHQHDKEEKLLNMKWRLRTLQNQALRQVINIFKKVNIETLKIEMYTSSLHVHLNKLQNQTTLCSWINDRMWKTQQACKIICAHLIEINQFISYFSIFKKATFLNISIHEEARLQFKHRWYNVSMLISTSE